MEILRLDLWSGEHYMNNDTYFISRPYGLFSNLTVMIYGIISFIKIERTPKKLSMKLIEYDNNMDIYPLLFKKETDIEINPNILNQINDIIHNHKPSYIGLGMTKFQLNNYHLFNIINDSYFQLNDNVNKKIENIQKIYRIDYENTLFVWARKTDKVTELSIPEVDDYINLIKLHNNNKKVIIQTDDPIVYNEFSNKGYYCLNYIPLSTVDKGFHYHMSDIDNNIFLEKYKMTKIEYLQKLLALVHVASKCDTVIIYPGCLSTYIPIIRGNWNNVYSFKNNCELI